MDLKLLLMQKGLKNVELAKRLGASPEQVSLQMNKHRLLPKKYLPKFCEVLGITEDDLIKAMNYEGGENE